MNPQTCKHGDGCYTVLLRQGLTAASGQVETWPRDSETTLEGIQPTQGQTCTVRGCLDNSYSEGDQVQGEEQ